ENLRAAFGAALLDLVPSYTTLLLQYDLLQLDPGEARARMENLRAAFGAALLDLVPSYTTLLLQYDLLQLDPG
ncbi:hypothetical protein ACLXBB_37255, partial [Pseudomonas aeruginosa]